MSDRDLVSSTNKKIVNNPRDYFVTRAKSFQVKTSPHDFVQYVKTVKAYALAGMPFADIANAGDFLGDIVERKEIDAPLQKSQENRIGEVAEDENTILAWQSRGERVLITHQLSSASSSSGKEVVVISQDLITTESAPEQTIDVLEGIKIEKKETISLPETSSSQQIENNPYLQAPAKDYD